MCRELNYLALTSFEVTLFWIPCFTLLSGGEDDEDDETVIMPFHASFQSLSRDDFSSRIAFHKWWIVSDPCRSKLHSLQTIIIKLRYHGWRRACGTVRPPWFLVSNCVDETTVAWSSTRSRYRVKNWSLIPEPLDHFRIVIQEILHIIFFHWTLRFPIGCQNLCELSDNFSIHLLKKIKIFSL